MNGSHGVRRPGGSALNSGQVGGCRAAAYIAARCADGRPDPEKVLETCGRQIENAVRFGREFRPPGAGTGIAEKLAALKKRMSENAAVIRSEEKVKKAVEEARLLMEETEAGGTASCMEELLQLYNLRDLSVSSFVYLSAILDYLKKGGRSRGSYLVSDPEGVLPDERLPEIFRTRLCESGFDGLIQETVFSEGGCSFSWRERRKIPEEPDWFETVWRNFLKGREFRQ